MPAPGESRNGVRARVPVEPRAPLDPRVPLEQGGAGPAPADATVLAAAGRGTDERAPDRKPARGGARSGAARRAPTNRGPAAASENRAAILAAARTLFAEQGYGVPLSAIARAAGVGQAVLYRHFPDRLELAWAVFADNLAELEHLAATTPGPECFGVLWRRMVEFTLASAAFVELVVQAHPTMPEALGEERFERLLAEPLARARDAGLADPRWTPSDILLLELMVYGVVTAQPDPSDARAAVARALELVDPRLGLDRS